MSMFFAFPVAAADPYAPITSSWHKTHALLAVASKETRVGRTSGSVTFFSDDGEHLAESTIRRSAEPCALAWHQSKRIIATGWESGEVLMWNEDTHALFQCKATHESHITSLTWSHDGTRLFSADDDGLVCVWRISKTGKASLTCDIRLNAGISHCVAIADATDDASMAFVATSENQVVLIDAAGTHAAAFDTTSAITNMSYDADSDSLVVTTGDLMVVHHKVGDEGKLSDKYEFKLSGKSIDSVAWAESGVLITTTGQNLVRVWCSEEGDTYALSLADQSGDFTQSDTLQHVAYDRNSRVLAACSRNGLVFMWRLNDAAKVNDEACWSFLPPVELKGSLTHVSWGPRKMLSVQNASDSVSILREHVIRKSFANGVAVVQVSASRAVVESHARHTTEADAAFKITGLHTDGKSIVLWSGHKVATLEIVKNGEIVRPLDEFACDASDCVLLNGALYTAEGGTIQCRGPRGASTQSLAFSEDMAIAGMHGNGHFLCAWSLEGTLKVWDVSKRQPRLAGTKSVSDDVDSIASAAISPNGECVAFVGAVDGKVDANLWLWDISRDSVSSKSVGVNRVPVNFAWDSTNSRVVVCETKLETSSDNNATKEVCTFFVTPDGTLITQGSEGITDNTIGPLIGVDIPRVFFALKGRSDDGFLVHSETLTDFGGLDGVDAATKRNMLEFSYQLTVGDLDAALKSVKGIDNKAIWHNMAKMCVSSKRLDVAAVCMGKLGNAVAGRVLREASKEPELDARVGALAVQLGMYEEAGRLYRECGRYDLENQLLQAQGRWEDAMAVAEEYDRVNLKSTFYNYAQQCELLGENEEAIKHYELSNTHAYEVPRMLFQSIDELDKYISGSKSKTLYKWWAQYLESTQDYNKALQFYTAAGDSLSTVRIHCFLDQIQKARDIVDKTEDKAAAYHLAKQYEALDKIEEAIEFFSKAESFSNAIRLARMHGMKKEMLGLALKSSKSDMLAAAEFYESEGQVDKAVTLYHKSGRVAKALEMCFAHNLHSALSDVAQNLDEATDPQLVERATEYFLENGQNERAVSLLIVSRRIDEALNLIADNDIFLTEEFAEKMTPQKGEMERSARNKILTRIASICHDQGSYQLATRKYTQASQHVLAMKSLLKCGDTNKIIFFANKCRTKEVYVLAANYLQALNWRADPEIMEHIVTFYKKGKALDTLSSFFESCATMEIDDYQNYEKALGALHEALKYLSKARMKDISEQEQRVATLQFKIDAAQRFIAMKEKAQSSPDEMVGEAQAMLEEDNINDAVRIGDIYSIMTEYYAANGRWQAAYDLLQEFRARAPRTNIAFYLSMKLVEQIHKELDIPLGQGTGAGNDGYDDEVGEEIDGEDV